MDIDLDGGKLLYALGIAFVLGALVYFTRDVVFGLSITVTAALLFAAFLGSLVVGIVLDRDVLDVVAYAVAGSSYLVFVAYVVVNYLDETGTFLLLVGSAVLFLGLGYVVRERVVALDRRTAGLVVGGVVVVSLLLVGADLLTADVAYSVTVENEVTTQVIDRKPADAGAVTVSVGTLTVRNPSPFTRSTDLPSMDVCLVGTDVPREDASLDYDPDRYDTSGQIAGGDERSHDVVVTARTTATNGTVTFAVEHRSDCDVTRETPTIVLVDEDRDD